MIRLLLLMATVLPIFTGCVSALNHDEKCAGEHPLRVFMVGNSYALSCCHYLPAVAASVPGCNLKLEVACIGGCSLQNHIVQYKASAENPEHRPYRDASGKPANLQELLSRDTWDIISIQQASHYSWKYETYQPWADQLIEIIRQTNPQAKIIIQQTWSYNRGDSRVADENSGWGIGQDGMYQRLQEAYQTLAKKTGFQIVPVGRAVQYTRERHPEQIPANIEEYRQELSEKYPYPASLPYADDAVGNMYWSNPEQLSIDTIHLSPYGDYLQACVWFGALFGRPVADITLYPAELPDRARLDFYRDCAQRALNDEIQP